MLTGLSIGSISDSIKLALRQALAVILGLEISDIDEPVWSSVEGLVAASSRRKLGSGAAVSVTVLIIASVSYLAPANNDPNPTEALRATVSSNTQALVTYFQNAAIALDPANLAIVNTTSLISSSITVVDRTPTRQPTPSPSQAAQATTLSPQLATFNLPQLVEDGSSTAVITGAALAALVVVTAMLWSLRRRWVAKAKATLVRPLMTYDVTGTEYDNDNENSDGDGIDNATREEEGCRENGQGQGQGHEREGDSNSSNSSSSSSSDGDCTDDEGDEDERIVRVVVRHQGLPPLPSPPLRVPLSPPQPPPSFS